MGVSASNMLSGSVIKLILLFSEFHCSENNAMKTLLSVKLSSTEKPGEIKDNSRKGNGAAQSPISATLTEVLWIIKVAFTP